jgi:hypothetical protein
MGAATIALLTHMHDDTVLLLGAPNYTPFTARHHSLFGGRVANCV